VEPHAAPTPRVLSRVREPVESAAARTTPKQRVVLPEPERTAVDVPRAPPPSLHAASPTRGNAIDRASAMPASERATASPPAVSPRQPGVAPTRRETASTPAPNGALLPAPVPVFATTDAVATRSARTATVRPATARTESRAAATDEPLVHVSIGRLEVRAAPPAAPAPPRRRDGPRPSSLDDYLRQRGKASP
jgi:hypothetical protein